MNESLVSFLYILLRDHLPAGTVELIMLYHVEKTKGINVEYSNPHTEAHARELAQRILSTPETKG